MLQIHEIVLQGLFTVILLHIQMLYGQVVGHALQDEGDSVVAHFIPGEVQLGYVAVGD